MHVVGERRRGRTHRRRFGSVATLRRPRRRVLLRRVRRRFLEPGLTDDGAYRGEFARVRLSLSRLARSLARRRLLLRLGLRSPVARARALLRSRARARARAGALRSAARDTRPHLRLGSSRSRRHVRGDGANERVRDVVVLQDAFDHLENRRALRPFSRRFARVGIVRVTADEFVPRKHVRRFRIVVRE